MSDTGNPIPGRGHSTRKRKGSIPAIDRVLRRTRVEDDCLVFTGCLNKDTGYGGVMVYYPDDTRRWRSCHRVVFEHEHGEIPTGMVIMHTCDNPPCVKLDHLRLGTYSENIQDAYDKGRKMGRREART